jgi:hypothetical protein
MAEATEMTASTATEPETDFYVLAWGLVAATVCTSLPIEDATKRLNLELPTGISSRWAPAPDKTFHTGEPNPHQCAQYAAHQHVLFQC